MARRRSGLAASVGGTDFLNAALLGYEQQRSEIDERIAELRRQLGRRGAGLGAAAGGSPVSKKRTLSAAARERIADAQRKRWAALRQTSKPGSVRQSVPVARRKMSAAGKKRIADAARKRWAAFRAKKVQTSAPPKVKTAGVQ